MRQALGSIALIPLILLLVACGSSASPTDTPLPPPKTATRSAIVASSSTSSASASSVSSTQPTIEPSATPVAALNFPTTTPAPPTPVIPSGLYVTSLQTIPETPVRGVDLAFYATFANNTNSPITFRWVVRIFRTDNPTKSFGQTTNTLFTDLTPGAKNQTSLGNWKLPLGGPCEEFIARVYFIDQNNQENAFKQPNGQVFEKPLVVCPPSDVPTATPGVATATPRPASASGLFVTNLRTDPNPPRRGSDIYFYPAFSNTTGTVQNYRWRILIYRSDNPARSYSDTAILQSAIPSGNSEQRSEVWKLALGGPCEDFMIRVVWLDQNNVASPFTMPDGKIFEKPMTICAP